MTVVASTDRSPDADLVDLARPGAKGEHASGAAVTRFLRHYESAPREREVMEVGLNTDAPINGLVHGRISGAFDPARFGYQVNYMPPSDAHAGVGMHTTTVTVTSSGSSRSRLETSPIFSSVPTASGDFDLSAMPIGDTEPVVIEVLRREHAGVRERGKAFIGATGPLTRADGVVDFPAAPLSLVTVRATSDVKPREGSHVAFAFFDEQSDMRGSNDHDDDMVEQLLLPPGTYLVRAATVDHAAALQALHVIAGTDTEATFPLLPWSPFRVRLVDSKGKAIGRCLPRIGLPGSDIPNPCRIATLCINGELRGEWLVPGTYRVYFELEGFPGFTRDLELTPDGHEVVVELPE